MLAFATFGFFPSPLLRAVSHLRVPSTLIYPGRVNAGANFSRVRNLVSQKFGYTTAPEAFPHHGQRNPALKERGVLSPGEELF